MLKYLRNHYKKGADMKKILLVFFVISNLLFSYRVISVSDGDTITIMMNGEKQKIRLYGIDTPEINQSFGTEAKQFLSDQILNKEVEIEVKDTDRYKRLVAIVYLNNKSMNELLLKEGWAWWYEAYSKKEYKYRELQEEAQRRKRGMWRNKGNIPPWEFRKTKKKK